MMTKLFGECTHYNIFEDVWKFKLTSARSRGKGGMSYLAKMLVVTMDMNIETFRAKPIQSTPKRTTKI